MKTIKCPGCGVQKTDKNVYSLLERWTWTDFCDSCVDELEEMYGQEWWNILSLAPETLAKIKAQNESIWYAA